MAEKVFSDFSGGMNALAAVDKLDPRECLLAENVRLDETGNVLSAGAVTAQNTSSYAGKVHSLYWNPGLGGVAGVGANVFQGLTLGGMASALSGANPASQKMSFASAPNRVYFDVGSVGYWSDQTNLLAVDWAPPVSVSSLGGPTIAGAGAAVGGGTAAWQSPSNITSTSSGSIASVPLTWGGTHASGQLQATMAGNAFAVSTTSSIAGVRVTMGISGANTANVVALQVTLLKAGVPVGTVKQQTIGTTLTTATFGGSADLWGATLTAADANASTFGFQVVAVLLSDPGQAVSVGVYNGVMTVYGGVATGMVAGTGAAGTLTGTYSWKVTFVGPLGEESDGSGDTVGIVLSGQQGTLTAINTGDARTVARNLYRKGGTLTSHYLVGTIQDNSSTTYGDNMTDILALATGVILAGDVPGDYPNSRLGQTASVRFPALHYDRVFWVNQAQKNQIVWSKPLNGFAYPTINTLNVGDGKPISRIVSIFGELIIIKTDSIWRLTGNDETSFDLTQTPSAVGTDMPFTIVALPDKIIFANRWGLWVFNGYTSVPLTTKLDLWFKQDDRTNEELFGVNGFHPPEVASATVPLNFDACGNSEKYYLAYAETGQSSNNATLVFDVKHGNITKRSGTGINPLSLAIDQVTGFVYLGDNAGFVSLLDDWNGTGQLGNPANFDFQTAYIDLERGSNKTLWALEFFLDTDGQLLTPYVYYDNGNASEALPAISTTKLERVVRPCEASTARKMQNFSVRLNGSIKPINSSGSPQIQFVHVKALYDLRAGRARTGQ